LGWRLLNKIQKVEARPLRIGPTPSDRPSLKNLEELFILARLGDRVGVDWWNYATPDGRSLHVALRYLAPYADPGKPWPKDDLVAGDRTRLFGLFAQALRHGDDPLFRKMLHFSPPDARWHLIWP